MSLSELDLVKVSGEKTTSAMSTEADTRFCDTTLRCMVVEYHQQTDDGTMTQVTDRHHGFSKA